MGVHLEMENLDWVFQHYASANPIIINDISGTIAEEKNKLDRMFLTVYEDTDLLSTVPMCQCKTLKGMNRLGVMCRVCHTPVETSLDRDIEPAIWVKAPQGVDTLINPHFWRMMNTAFTFTERRNSFSVIKWFCNTDYHPPASDFSQAIQELRGAGFERGLNYFYRNFDHIIATLAKFKNFNNTKPKKEKVQDFLQFVAQYRDRIFPKHIPIPNKTVFVIENTKFGTYEDSTLAGMIDAVRNITGIDHPSKFLSASARANRIAKLTEQQVIFAETYEKEFMCPKPGILRKNVFGSRAHATFRAVIVSVTDIHRHDELQLPWPLAVTLLSMHLLNKMFRDGYSPNEAIGYLNNKTYQYDAYIDKLFTELITESPYRGIPCVFNRNPFLYRASMQRMFITSVNKDPTVFAIGFSPLSVNGPNATKISNEYAILT